MATGYKNLKLGPKTDIHRARKIGKQEFGAGNFKVGKSGGRWVVSQTGMDRPPLPPAPQVTSAVNDVPPYTPGPQYQPQAAQLTPFNPLGDIQGYNVANAPQTTSVNAALPGWAANSLNMVDAQGQHHQQYVANQVLPGFASSMGQLQGFNQAAMQGIQGIYGQGQQAGYTAAGAVAPPTVGGVPTGGQGVQAMGQAAIGQGSTGAQLGAYSTAMGQIRPTNVALGATKALGDIAAGLPAEYARMRNEKELQLRDMVDNMRQWRDQLDAQKWEAGESMRLDEWSTRNQLNTQRQMFNAEHQFDRDRFSNEFGQAERQYAHGAAQEDAQFAATNNLARARAIDTVGLANAEMLMDRQDFRQELYNIDRQFISDKNRFGQEFAEQKRSNRVNEAIQMFSAQGNLATSLGGLGLDAAGLAQDATQFWAGLGAEERAALAGNAQDQQNANWLNPNNLAADGWRRVQAKPGPKYIRQGTAVQATDGSWWVRPGQPAPQGGGGGGGSGGGGGGGGSAGGGGGGGSTGEPPRGREGSDKFVTWWSKFQEGGSAYGRVEPPEAAQQAANWISKNRKLFTKNGKVNWAAIHHAVDRITGGSTGNYFKAAIPAALEPFTNGNNWK